MAVIAGTGIIISIEYAENGLDWARLYDNLVLGWYVDEVIPMPMRPDGWSAETRAPPQTAPGIPPVPVILGHLLAVPENTAPVISPQWVKYTEPNIFAPDIWRGRLRDFFPWLSTNNGARRRLGSRLAVNANLVNAYRTWAANNPDLVLAD